MICTGVYSESKVSKLNQSFTHKRTKQNDEKNENLSGYYLNGHITSQKTFTKRKELEKQQAREAFREAFEVLLESQDASTKTQNLMLDELQRLNARIEEAEQAEQQPQGRYADRFPRGRDGRIILYGDSGDGGCDSGDDRRGDDDGGDPSDNDDDQFFDA